MLTSSHTLFSYLGLNLVKRGEKTMKSRGNEVWRLDILPEIQQLSERNKLK